MNQSTFGVISSKTGQGRKPLLMPIEGQSELADAIENRLTYDKVLKELGMVIAPNCLKPYTVAVKCMKACCEELSKQMIHSDDDVLSVMGMIEMSRSNKLKSSAEKAGNLDPVFEPGYRAIRALNGEPIFGENEELIPMTADGKPDVASEEYVQAVSIQSRAARELLGYDIVMSAPDFSIYAVTIMYLRCVIEELAERAQNNPLGEAEFSLYEELDIYVKSTKDGLQLFFHPGAEAKLIIKSDAETEST